MTSPAEHAATVEKALAELRELAARMPDAEDHRASQDWCVDCGEWVQEHGLALAEVYRREVAEVTAQYEQAAARADELERERDERIQDCIKWHDKFHDANQRRKAAEAALRQIANARLHSIPGVNPDGSVSSDSMAVCIARAALGEQP